MSTIGRFYYMKVMKFLQKCLPRVGRWSKKGKIFSTQFLDNPLVTCFMSCMPEIVSPDSCFYVHTCDTIITFFANDRNVFCRVNHPFYLICFSWQKWHYNVGYGNSWLVQHQNFDHCIEGAFCPFFIRWGSPTSVLRLVECFSKPKNSYDLTPPMHGTQQIWNLVQQEGPYDNHTTPRTISKGHFCLIHNFCFRKKNKMSKKQKIFFN